MTISFEDFGVEMNRLGNAFNRTISKKVIDGWYREIQEKDERVFRATITELLKLDSYPNLGQFWSRYHVVATKFINKTDDDFRG